VCCAVAAADRPRRPPALVGRRRRIRIELQRSRRRGIGSFLRPDRHEVEFLGRVRGIVAFEHVDDHDGDVVATARLVGLVDQTVGGHLRVGLLGQDRRDVDVGHLVDEAVAAQHEPISSDEWQRPPVDADLRLDAQRPRDDVAPWVIAGLVLADVAGGHQFLHVAVIDGDPSEPSVSEQVRAGVTDVGEHQRFAGLRWHHRGDVTGQGVAVVGVDVRSRSSGERIGDDGDRRHGRAHPLLVGVRDRGTEDVAVRRADRLDDLLRSGWLLAGQEFADAVDGDLTRDFAGLVAAHPVGDDEQSIGHQEVVLVRGPDPTRVRGGADAQLGHQVASVVVTATVVSRLVVSRLVVIAPRSPWCRPARGRRGGAAGCP
jgi:hypothetical protein